MSEIQIRRAQEKDAPAIGRLLYQVHKVHSDVRPDLFKPGGRKYNDGELKEIIRDDKRPIFVAVEEDEVLGYAFCIHQQVENDDCLSDRKTLYIDDLCVDENVRGRGVGRTLYGFVVDHARKTGHYNVTLNVWADNKKALAFYESLDLHVQKIGMEKLL